MLRLVNPKEDKELALTLNGKKKRMKVDDFLQAANAMGIDRRVVLKLMKKYMRLVPRMEEMIRTSFLSEELQEGYVELLRSRVARLA